mmetsp:Transcript_4091/g.9244  ORF Transcript_4091/g.9244 Transcript_4091/m.9244 type:complete len:112 (-) Transcript_4091:48-383(-)
MFRGRFMTTLTPLWVILPITSFFSWEITPYKPFEFIILLLMMATLLICRHFVITTNPIRSTQRLKYLCWRTSAGLHLVGLMRQVWENVLKNHPESFQSYTMRRGSCGDVIS